MFKKRKVNEKATVLKLSDDEDNPDKQKEATPVEPRKIVHEQRRPALSSSTAPNKQRLESDVKESFDELNYKGGNIIAVNEDVAVLPNLAETEKERDARSKYIENVEITKKIKDGELDPSVYRGLNGYANYTANEQVAKDSKHRSNFGPLRAPTNIRISCRFDYNPELCKDWHDSGYCVFGNSCLYLHDRTTYKTGWELEKDFENQQRERWKRINNPDYQEEFEFKEELEKHAVEETCKLCEKPFVEPVSIECGHVFCEKCAIKQNSTKKKCATCGKPTFGIMNDAAKTMEKARTNYQQVKKSLQEQAERNKNKRKRFAGEDSQRVFE